VTDYGHPLSFGTVLTPMSARPGSVVDLTRLSEAVDLDIVSVPDHPYQPRLLEAWTVLSVVAAHPASCRASLARGPSSSPGVTLEHGVSGYLLATDRPDTIRRFAAEVAPAVRKLVATERDAPS
jgi:hypothetical protein